MYVVLMSIWVFVLYNIQPLSYLNVLHIINL